MNATKQIHCVISGRVQGVFFRASTREEAGRLGLHGWVSNLADGRVEVLACGEEIVIDEFLQWLKQGPPMANVDEVEFIEDADDTLVSEGGFYVR